jgi:hypothetical protein
MDANALHFEEYIVSILYSMTPEERKLIDENVLREFVTILEHSNLQDRFAISLNRAVGWLGHKSERHLADLLFPRRLNKTEKKSNYVEDVDYTIRKVRTAKNQLKNEIFLSIDCFKDLCQRMNIPQSKTIRKYLSKVETIHRDSVSRILSVRTGSYKTAEQLHAAYSFDDGTIPEDGNIVYFDVILQHGRQFYKIGHTKHGRIRLQALRMDYPGLHHFKNVIRIHHNVALEEIIKALSEKWQVKCSTPPCPKEVFFTKDYPVEAITEASLYGWKASEKKLQELLHRKELKPGSLGDSNMQTPFQFNRRKRHYLLRNGVHEKS